MIYKIDRAKKAAILPIVWASLSLAGCSHVVDLTILATTDFHGALEATRNDLDTGRPLGGADALVRAVREQRATNPDGTIYLDGGDSLHGTALSNFSQGGAVVELMNLAGLDASAVGNHEFDFGIDELLSRIDEADYPFLGANIVSKGDGKAPEWATPYKIFDLHGVRVGVIGLATVSTPITTLPSNVENLRFEDPAEAINRLVNQLVPSQADLVVVVGHLGVFSSGTAVRGELADLAEGIQGVAALVGGHTHQLFAGELAGIPTIQAGEAGTALGRIDIAYNAKRRRVRSSRVEVLPLGAETFDVPQVQELIAKYRKNVDGLMQEVIAVAEVTIERSRRGESAMGNLVTDAWRSQVDAEFVFQNPGGVRSSFDQGPVTYEDLYRVLPFENTVVMVDLTGAEIEELLLQGATAGYLQVSGLRYTIDISRSPAEVVSTDPELEADRTYRVSINNFMAEGGDGLEILNRRPEAVDTGIAFRDVVAAWLRSETARGRKIQPLVDGRVRIIGG